MNTRGQLLGRIFLIALLVVPSPCLAAGKKPVTVSSKEIDLAGRERAVAAKEKELAAQEEQLQELQKETESRLEQLDALQKKVTAKLAELKTVKDQRLKNLVKVYSAMRPAKVAPLLDGMDDKAVVGILRAMKTKTIAQILPKLDRAKAVRISEQLGMIK